MTLKNLLLYITSTQFAYGASLYVKLLLLLLSVRHYLITLDSPSVYDLLSQVNNNYINTCLPRDWEFSFLIRSHPKTATTLQ
jgi:hypothetical protein